MQAAVLIIDMVKDTFDEAHPWPITPLARAIVEPINTLTARARARGWPIIFACDSFLPGDFIFGGRMEPHALRDTPGSEVTELLHREPGDVYLPKRRFSAFFKTDLDQTLRLHGVDTVAVCGIATHFCVLATALDALSHDFQVVLVSDATASFRPEIHEETLSHYRKNPLHPLFQVLAVDEVLPSDV